MPLVDRRIAGIARGVGTAEILGRVHSAHPELEDPYFPCSFTIMEGPNVHFLFGLGMLKAHQACIDIERKIQGHEVHLFAEHKLPEKARIMDSGEGEECMPESSAAGGASGSGSSPALAQPSPGVGIRLANGAVHAPVGPLRARRPGTQPRHVHA